MAAATLTLRVDMPADLHVDPQCIEAIFIKSAVGPRDVIGHKANLLMWVLMLAIQYTSAVASQSADHHDSFSTGQEHLSPHLGRPVSL